MIINIYPPNTIDFPTVLFASASIQFLYCLVMFLEILFEQTKKLAMATIKIDTLKNGFIIIYLRIVLQISA